QELQELRVVFDDQREWSRRSHGVAGTRTVNVAPLFSMLPPCAFMIASQTVRPMPGGAVGPDPSSEISIVTLPSSFTPRIEIGEFGGLYFEALSSKLINTCSKSTGSTGASNSSSGSFGSPSEVFTSRPDSDASTRAIADASSSSTGHHS